MEQLRETEKVIPQFFQHLGIEVVKASDPPDFETVNHPAGKIGIEATSISSHWVKRLSEKISSIETTKGHYIKIEEREPDVFWMDDVHSNRRQNRKDRENCIGGEIIQFLQGCVNEGDFKDYSNYGVKVRMTVLGRRKKGGHVLAQYDTLNVLPFLLARIKGALDEKVRKMTWKADSYAQSWLIVTMCDGFGRDLSLQDYGPFGDLWYWFLYHAYLWGEDFAKLGFDKIAVLDAISGGHVEWHFHNKRVFEVSILFGAGMQNWKCPKNMDTIAAMSGDEMLENSIITAGGRTFGTISPDKVPPLPELLNRLIPERPYMGWTINHPFGYSFSNMVLGELYTSLDEFDPNSLSAKNSIVMSLPKEFVGHLEPRPSKIKKFVLDRFSENDKQLISQEGITGMGINASMMGGLRGLNR